MYSQYIHFSIAIEDDTVNVQSVYSFVNSIRGRYGQCTVKVLSVYSFVNSNTGNMVNGDYSRNSASKLQSFRTEIYLQIGMPMEYQRYWRKSPYLHGHLDVKLERNSLHCGVMKWADKCHTGSLISPSLPLIFSPRFFNSFYSSSKVPLMNYIIKNGRISLSINYISSYHLWS